MCQYINVAISADIKADKLKSLFAKHGLAYHPFQNSFVLQQFKKNVQLVNTTTNQCDCGSVIGSDSNQTKGIQPNDIERLKRKGWSETKINNWITNKTKNEFQANDRDKERSQWKNFLREATGDNYIGSVVLYIHWYDDSIYNEQITFTDKQKISFSDLQTDTLDKLKYDVLYEFIP